MVGGLSVCLELPGTLGFTGFSDVVVFGPVLTGLLTALEKFPDVPLPSTGILLVPTWACSIAVFELSLTVA